MKKKRKNKGITLIALIITIIVLLILAGVTMSFVVGDNGVLTQAQKAKIRSDQTSAQEDVDIEVVGSYDDEGNLDLELLNKNLISNLKDLKLKSKTTGEYEDFTESNQIERLPATVYYKQTEVKIKDLLSNVAKDPENYGMYVDYPIDLSGDGDTINDWRIFYEDKTGRVFLIAADYAPNTCGLLQKEGGSDGELIAGMSKSTDSSYSNCCYNWSTVPGYTCNDGRNGTNKDKSQCSFLDIFMPEVDTCNGHYYCSDHTGNDNSKCASQLQCTGEWSGFVDSKYAEYAIGGPTIEMWLGSWNSHTDKSKYEELKYNDSAFYSYSSGYSSGESSSSSSTHLITTTDGKNDTLYFPHLGSSSNLDLFNDKKNGSSEGGTEKASCYCYWLASPSGGRDDCVMSVDYKGNLSGSFYYNGSLACRPVILLKSEVYVEVQEDGTVIKSCRLIK